MLGTTWIPAMDGVADRLTAGARIADVGCGHGASAIVLAEAFPASRVSGFDLHDPSIQVAGKRAAESSSRSPRRPGQPHRQPDGRAALYVVGVDLHPNSLSQEVGLGIGAQAGPARLTEVLDEAGFSRVEVVSQTPLNLIIQGPGLKGFTYISRP